LDKRLNFHLFIVTYSSDLHVSLNIDMVLGHMARCNERNNESPGLIFLQLGNWT